jgi:predicted adenine nucleotide alpha hydrolase (AANH) superfamily ATPase
MNILLHICCGPCAIYPLKALERALAELGMEKGK